jgi:hypothetical protein
VEPCDAATLAVVSERLGREPRGLREVAVRDAQGLPVVIRVASVVDGRPFPTLYWLVDPQLGYRIDRAEAGGLIAQLQARVDREPALRARMREDHQRHIRRRADYLQRDEIALLERSGMWNALSERGIGGIADFSRIRCLHTWYAAHLVVPNTIGALLDAHWSAAQGQSEQIQTGGIQIGG